MGKGSTIRNDPFAALIPAREGAHQRADEPEPPRPPDAARPPATKRASDRAAEGAPPAALPPVTRAGREKLTVHLEAALVNRVKNAAYWNPRLTIARIAERGIRLAIEEVERENDGAYPQRESELVGGRPIK